MDYGALITLTDDGFQIPATSLTPIGVYNDTKCWGAFYQNTDMPDFDEAKQHLLLSPIPFGSWACAIRIIARVKDNTGMLHKLLSTLMDDKLCLNIIAIAQTIGGYNHAMVTIVSEAIDLRKEADYIRKEVKDAEKNEAILGFAVKVAHRIVEIDEAISRKEDDFIYTKGKDKLNSESAKSQIKQYCMDPETMDKKVSITNAIDTCLQMTVWNVNWVSSTAYCFFYHPTQPLRFLYDAKRALLRYSDNDAIENRIARTLELPTPLLFLGSFDPLNKYVRLLCVQREMRERRLLKVRYTYECMDKRKDADIAKTGSRGSLSKKQACSQL